MIVDIWFNICVYRIWMNSKCIGHIDYYVGHIIYKHWNLCWLDSDQHTQCGNMICKTAIIP